MTFRRLRQTFGAFPYHLITEKATLDATPEERRLLWETFWELGGFRLWVANYADIFTNQVANDKVYAFWREKVRDRLKDERMKDKLAPMVPPHPFGTKRPSLEQRYYEVFNQPNVTLVDLNETPIDEITEKPDGIRSHKLSSQTTMSEQVVLGFRVGRISDVDFSGWSKSLAFPEIGRISSLDSRRVMTKFRRVLILTVSFLAYGPTRSLSLAMPWLHLQYFFLYAVLGWSSFVGLGTIIILFPLPGCLAKLVQKVQKACCGKERRGTVVH
ncbi:hypothetical protein VKT23_002756 [Stygiomarasmius scandens]|uniref:Uncharacterized protein n=1 Tax=Marasmiellus scandens TaxID=2682957 RepID=A0ABR1JXM5_9AGAR